MTNGGGPGHGKKKVVKGKKQETAAKSKRPKDWIGKAVERREKT